MSEQSKKSTKSVKSKQPDKAEARNKGGRPAIVIDVEILEKLAGTESLGKYWASQKLRKMEKERKEREAQDRRVEDRERATLAALKEKYEEQKS